MRKILLLLIVAGFTKFSFAQTDAFETQNKIYKSALKNYDLSVATNALYNMIALKPERTDLNDSLVYLYFGGERYAQTYLLGEQILKADGKRNDILELVAISKQNLGLIKEALSDYEKLYAETKSIYYVYQQATLQYQLKRFGECIASLDQIIASTETEKQKVNIRVQGGSQDVPMKAAAYNVKGICALELNQQEAAKENFNKALQIFPDFMLPKGNLEAMNKKTEGKAPANKPAAPVNKPAQPKSK
jgi:tetratricopeptide (TPR) repeat protein